MKVVGFVGLPGSGKSEAANVARELGVPVVTMGDVVREECQNRGLDPAEHHGDVARSLRKENGAAAIAELSLPLLDDALADSEVVVVDGIRSGAEVESFETSFGDEFLLVGIEAPFDVRSARVEARGRDTVSPDRRESLARREKRERVFGFDEAMNRVDRTIENTGTLAEFREQTADLLREYLQKEPADSVPNPSDEPVRSLDGDQLDRAAYARYLAGRISSVSHDGAYAIHLHGPWGSGKSTLLNFLEDLLTERPDEYSRESRDGTAAGGSADGAGSKDEEWLVVRFNAWQHQHLRPPWWTLMDHVYRQGRHDLSWRDRVREFSWRLTAGRSAVLLQFAAIAWVVAIASFLLGTAPDGSGLLATVSGLVADLSPIIAILVTIWASIETVSDSLLFGSAKAAQSYVNSTSDPMNTIEDRFGTLIDRVPKPVAIFIDDLDRCDGEYVVDLLNGIQTLFDDAQVVFVVAADEQWLNSCFEQRYGDQQSQVAKPGKSLGGLFLEKLFQLSFPVPNPSTETKAEYWEQLIRVESDGTDESVAEMRERAVEEMRSATDESEILRKIGGDEERSFVEEQVMREEAVARLADPEIMARTEHVLQPFAPLLEPNPRSMKQFVNAYSVNRTLATLTHVDVDRETLALWTVLALRWPKLAAFAGEHPEVVTASCGPDENVGEVDDEEVRRLLAEPAVEETVTGEPVAAELDAAAVERCAGIHP